MITLYSTKTGKPVEVIHAIDARDYVRGGAYTAVNPADKLVMPEPSEAKPTEIPTVVDKKPAEKPTVNKNEKINVTKPIKKTTRIVKK